MAAVARSTRARERTLSGQAPGPGESARSLALPSRIDLRATLGPLVRGAADPTTRVAANAAIRATVTPAGPATIEVRVVDSTIRAIAWGPGAEWVLEALPAALGLDDDDTGFEPGHHPLVAQLARRLGPARLGRTGVVWEALLPAILEQKVTGTEARQAFRRLVRSAGERAPGPHALWLPPTPAAIAALPPWRFPPLGIEPRRGALLKRLAADARRLEAIAAPARAPGGGGAGALVLAAALRSRTGVGPWTAAEVTLRALGDPDAVSVGDAHLCHVVSFALTGQPRGTDERMLELLAPWAGHRARVVHLLERSGIAPPRYGPRVAPRDITKI